LQNTEFFCGIIWPLEHRATTGAYVDSQECDVGDMARQRSVPLFFIDEKGKSCYTLVAKSKSMEEGAACRT